MRFRIAISAMLAVLGGWAHSTAQDQKLSHQEIFDSSKLLQVEIEIPEKDWDQLRRQSRDFATGFSNPSQKPYSYFKGNVTINGKRIEAVGIRKKGFFGSADTVRPSLKIKFDQYVDQDPAAGFSRLTLNNNKQDGAQVSQLLTYEIFRKAGIHAPRVSLAKVSVNGKSLGIYSNVESIKKPFLKRGFPDVSGNLYEGTLTDFHPLAVERIEAKTNDKDPQRKSIAALAEAVWQEKFDPAQIEKLIDIDHFMKYWAVESLTGFWDGYASNQNNYFLYQNPENNKFYFIPWGADWTLQRNNPFNSGRLGRGFGGGDSRTPAPTTAVYAQATIPNKLYRSTGYPEKYKAAMNEVLSKAFEEKHLLAEIDRVESLVKDHLHSAQRNFENSLDQTREFIKNRRQQVVDALANSPVSIPNEPRKPSYTVTHGQFSGSFTTRWVNDARAVPKDKSVTLTLKMDGKPVELEDLVVVAKPGRVFRFGGGAGNQTPPAVIEIRGKRKSDQSLMTFTLSGSQDHLKNTDEPVSMNGRLAEGTNSRAGGNFGGGFGGGFGGRNSGRTLNAMIAFETASTEEGQTVSGNLTGQIVENRGGLFGRRNTPPARGAPASSDRRIMTALDVNRDGELSIEEVKNATEALLKLDRNQDGKLSQLELGNAGGRGSARSGGASAGRRTSANRDGSSGSPTRRPQLDPNR